MKGIKYTFFVWFFLGIQNITNAQNITVDETLTPTQLVENILINNPCANISNVSVTTWNFQDGQSFGRFTSGGSAFPFADGVVLTTGRAASAVGPNTSILSEGPDSWGGDTDLEQALNIGPSSINATVLEFDFLPLSDKISFDYIFSSEQYLSNPNPNQCGFTDGFVFLLKKANSTDAYSNLAVVPGSDTPVRVNTVRGSGTLCPPSNEQFFDAFNTSDHPTNYNGQTKILTAQSNVEPGILYHIKLVVADQGNRQYDSAIFIGGGSFKIEKDLGEDRLFATNNPLCFQSTLELDATEPGTNTYQWSRNGVSIAGAVNPLFTVSEAGIYTVAINLGTSGCVSTGEIEIEYDTQLMPSTATIVVCDPDFDGITTFNLTKATATILSSDSSIQFVEYYEDAFATVQVANAMSYTSGPTTVYAQVFNANNCGTIVPVTLVISNTNPGVPAPIEFCDEDGTKDGIRLFDLATEVSPQLLNALPPSLVVSYFSNINDAVLGVNALPNGFSNTVANQQTIWARITNGPDCYGIIPVILVVHFLEVPNFDDEEKIVCEGLNSVVLSVPAGFQTYLWNDANASTSNTIRVGTAGTFTVEVTDANGCIDTKTFTVEASGVATITDVVIVDFAGGSNSVTVEYSGSGDYEFSLDGTNYQESPTFYNVQSGSYTVYVQDKNFCGKQKREIFVLDYPKFFTPNGDGYNDVWKITYLQKEHRRAQVSIFDRYGKLVFSGTGDNAGWDGTFNSNNLPASDYWFTIVLEDGRVIKNHFSLKR
jgi:gliding motility-associated-like protein